MRFYNRIKDWFRVENLIGKENIKGELPKSKEAYLNYIKVAWPAAMQGLLLDLMLAVDLAMVGALGADALASVGIMGQPKMVILIFARALAIPVTAMVARRKGEGRTREMNSVLKQGIMINLIFYIPVIVASFLFLPQIVAFAGAKGKLILGGTSYGKYIVVGLFFATITQVIGAALIGTGDTKTVFKANATGNILNTILNILLIYGIWIFPRLEVAGAGIATMIGNIVTLIIILRAVSSKGTELNIFDRKPWRFNRTTLKSFFKLGVSSLGEQIFERFGMFAYAKMVAGLGVISFATHYVCMNLCDVFYSFASGLGHAGSALTGQNLGKAREDLAQIYGKIGIRISMITATLFFTLYIGARWLLMDIYTDDPKVMALGAQIIVIMAVACFPQIGQLVYAGVLKGAGDSLYVMLYSLFIIAIFRPILTYILCFTVGWGLYGAWLALLIDQNVRLIVSYKRFKSGKWKLIKV